MDPQKEEVKQHCIEALHSLGASKEFSQFYADVLQCEHDITHHTYELQKELRETVKNKNGTPFFATIQKLSKNFNMWRITAEELSAKHHSDPSLKFDPPKFSQAQRLKAVCSLETNELKLKEGEEMIITDATQPYQLKVRNPRGEEGYVPALSCVLPIPDSSAVHALERLQIQLLTSWTECVARLRPILHQMIVSTSSNILTQWMSCGKNGHSPWEQRVTRRMKRINEIFAKDLLPNEGIDLSRLHKTLSSLENELTWQKSNDLSKLIDTVSSLDKTILCYQAFRKQWHLFRKSLKESVRPIRIVNWDPKKFQEHGRNLKYFELKLTAEEILTKEETVYLKAKKDEPEAPADKTKKNKMKKKSETDQYGSKRESVSAEEMTSRSHEENKRFVVKSVVDPRDGRAISIKEAVAEGIINHTTGLYANPATGQTKTISAAMGEGLIQIEYATSTKTQEKVESIGLITIRSQIDNHEYSITGAIDTRSGERLDADEARRRETIDESTGYFIDLATGTRYPLDDAIERGWVFAQYDDEASGEPQFETKTYAINSVVDQSIRKAIPFVEAIRKGLIDRESGNYINNLTGERVFAAEAIRRGFFKSVVVEDPSTLNIDATNRVVVDRIERVRKNVLRGVRVISAFSKALKAAAAEKKAAPEKKE